MARRKTTDPEPTLFPFLSVLAAVMGTLVLIISGMSQIALASPRQHIEVDAFRPDKKSPVYVECRAGELLIYPDDPTAGAPVHLESDAIPYLDGAWSTLVARLEQDSTRYLLLLVRQDGVATFRAARATLGDRGIDVGYEPLFGDGDVRFQPRRQRR